MPGKRNFAKAAARFLPLIPTTPHKAKWAEICRNFFIFPLHGIILTIFQNSKNGRKKTGNLFLIPCFSMLLFVGSSYSIFLWLQFYKSEFIVLQFSHLYIETTIPKYQNLYSGTVFHLIPQFSQLFLLLIHGIHQNK